jgi:DNA-binding NarL/FixJ family response regulator
MPAPVRIFLVDSSALFREALRKLLETDAEFVVVGEAANADDTLRLTTVRKPDVVLLNWAMPDAMGEIVLRALGTETLRLRVIVLTAEIEQSTILNALKRGARGVVLKTSGYAEKTVKHHLTHIFEKVGVSNRLELAVFAQAHHFQPTDAPVRLDPLDQTPHP